MIDLRWMKVLITVTAFTLGGPWALAQDLPLSMIIIEGEDWELVSEGHQFTEGPAVNAEGEVFFTDVPTSEIFKIDLAGKVTRWTDQSERTAGAMFGPNGVLYGTSMGAGAIVKFSESGKPTPIVSDVQCNDLVVTGRGAIYFTDHINKKLFYISPQGDLRQVDQDIALPNGLILWPDQQQLVVSNTYGSELWTYRIEKDGSLSHKQAYSTMRLPHGNAQSGADGMTVDKVGRIYVCTHEGVQVFDTQGRLSGILAKPQQKFLSNICFGGAQLDTIYVTTTDKVYRRKLNTQGVRFSK
ncbi:MAG: SMP-30/gluconolactonase/LRE family protein [Planctomycetota bacterium]|nr:SMP-30/gluconolactonase/LRE family protein [Planctomycetota bacterium]